MYTHLSRISRSTFFLSISLTASVFADAQGSADEPVHLENLIVTASPFSRDQAELASATNVLAGQNLLLAQQSSLGATLDGQPGIALTYFGPGASRPVIRGLGDDRVRVPNNGTGIIDASSAKRIESEFFVRGANLADQEARSHNSFLKDIAPLPGRDVTIGVRVAF